MIRLILTVLIGCVSMGTTAQTFIGLSINYGDKLTFTPNYHDLLLKRNSFSPTIVFSKQNNFPSDLSLLFSGEVGIAGYQLVPVLHDTLSTGLSGDRNPFVDYAIFVSRFGITPGKVFHLNKKELFIGLGGGISYYYIFYQYSSMGVSVTHQGASVDLFSAYIEAPSFDSFSGFAKLYTRISLSNRLDIAFQYSRHWNSILTGEFEFYHTKTPASGSIKLVPQAISLIFLYRFKKNETK